MGTDPTKHYDVTWLRPEYQDREHELVTAAEVARIAEVDRYTITSWRRRYDHFPAPVKEIRTGPGPTRSFVTAEIIDWLLDHRPRTAERSAEPARLRILRARLNAEATELARQLRHTVNIRDHIDATLGD